MSVLKDFVSGALTVIRVLGEPKLYRYPYRNSGEAARGDWLRIGDDIRNVLGRIEMELKDDDERPAS